MSLKKANFTLEYEPDMHGPDADQVFFQDGDGELITFNMDSETWTEMGCPDEVVVTVQPKDEFDMVPADIILETDTEEL